MNKDLDISEIKPAKDTELGFFCKDALCVYGSGYGTAADAEDEFEIYLKPDANICIMKTMVSC